MTSERNLIFSYLSPFFDRRTYTNILYLFLSFPLGLAYFMLMVIGFSLGFGLLVVLVGVPILIGVLIACWFAIGFERTLANTLLGTDIPTIQMPTFNSANLWAQLRLGLTDTSNWKGLIYLFARFPFGIFAFVSAVLSVVLPFAFIFAPLTYNSPNTEINIFNMTVDTLPEALIVSGLGLLITPLLLHGVNLICQGWAQFATAMLTGERAKTKRDLFYDDKAKRVTVPADDYDHDYTYEHEVVFADEQLSFDEDTTPDPAAKRRRTLAELLDDSDEPR